MRRTFNNVFGGVGRARSVRATGFTLIELLVVIAIIGILASIVLASLNSARVKSRDARRVADIKQLQLALELYYNDNSAYPTALSALSTNGYISAIPTDPSSGSYVYSALGSGATCSSYHLGAALEQNNTGPGSPLASDANADASAPACTGSAPNFNGINTQNCAGSNTAGRYCYDVKP